MQLFDRRSFAYRLTDMGATALAGSGEARGPQKRAARRRPCFTRKLSIERSEGERSPILPILRAPAGDGETEPREADQHHDPRRCLGDRSRRRVGERHTNGMPHAWASRLVGVQDERSGISTNAPPATSP
jgi:hypothetical protein